MVFCIHSCRFGIIGKYGLYDLSSFCFWTSEYLRPAAKNAPHAIELVFKAIGRIFHLNVGLGVFLVISAAIVIILYLLLPVFSEGALIQLIAKLRGGHKVTMVEGVNFGFTRFLQLFEYNTLIKTFGLVGILTEASFAFRNLGPEVFGFFVWIFILFIVVGFS